ncbi:phospholipase D-like domain-containing protein [Brevundimonas sp.]|uniref:phospholipase D-like domain-containing protein n=1 Tax=Brevundimonas sp. TaxID=1871086 RepID=UPI0025D4119A|nr:phospholipase D-like domain-containing protein [Brevundimonas sp.]
MLLQPGVTCWRTARADRVALLVENASYFAAVKEALEKAERTISLLGWQFDPRTRLDPLSEDETGPEGEVGHVLRRLVRDRPELNVRLLIWKSPLPIAISQGLYPHKAMQWFRRRTVDMHLEPPWAIGSCHHQKVLVIDDRLAFCGGGDISIDRWDSAEHLDDDVRRCTPSGIICQPRHEVMMMVDGPAAMALGDLFRDRWRRATGERLKAEAGPADPWPRNVRADMTDAEVGVCRTQPATRRRAAVRENEALHLESIGRARQLIYLENQYFTSPLIAAALAQRLEEPDGPEVVLVSTGKSPSWFDQATMDGARAALLRTLRKADVFGRLSAWRPRTARGQNIIVHSKVSIIDDRLLRVGSTNLNNRSCGFDTECDLAVEREAADDFIRAFRQNLIAHFLGVEANTFANVEAVSRSVGQAIADLNTGRMARLTDDEPGWWGRFIAEYQLGDPAGRSDAWRPWRRRRLSALLEQEVQAAIADSASTSKSITSGR